MLKALLNSEIEVGSYKDTSRALFFLSRTSEKNIPQKEVEEGKISKSHIHKEKDRWNSSNHWSAQLICLTKWITCIDDGVAALLDSW